ncbi:NADH-quinone oxidoreductase subunit C [uncultured Selenomonas sp.]|uniref:NADH-quinone oxidoreductase subunit C n=1 Tax=uncultured Selenomonas sp. TaxID=159275 RepID=UPI0028EF8539|nr:NADH-quinone oxidoreductase subunit C [uncultured Selenomonas sp.]
MRNDYLSAEALAGIKLAFSNAVYDAEAVRAAVYIGADELIALLTFLRDDTALQLTRMENVTAVDWKDRFEMVYHLFSPVHMHWLTVKVTLPHDTPVVPSATAVFPGVEFEEREVYDLMGISFTGHPDLRRVFHHENFVGHPLRKDFVPPPPPNIPRIRKEGM